MQWMTKTTETPCSADIDGNYNVNQAGTYTLQYYVQDSDGNTSDPITFTLTVQ